MTTPRTLLPSPQPNGQRRPAGFTLIEVVIGLAVFGALITASMKFVSAQGTALASGVDHMTGLQNLRHVITTLEDDILTAATNLPADQPGMVYAGDDVIAFNADYATNAASDWFSVYYEPDAPAGQVSALSAQITIPTTSFTYPDTTYETPAGTPSPAELLILYFEPDNETSRSDDYRLLRQINAGTPELVARDLLRVDGQPFFRYYRTVDFATAPTAIDSVSSADLPLTHAAPIHRSPADTGSAALIDRVRAVRFTGGTTNAAPGEHERIVETSRVVQMPNMGFNRIKTCGDEPIMGSSLTASIVQLAESGEDAVQLSWNRATDEGGGEQDVIRYVIYRIEGGGGAWEDPYLGIAAGAPTYVFLDTSVTAGESYRYAVAAQDCTPSLSGLSVSSTVTLPGAP